MIGSISEAFCVSPVGISHFAKGAVQCFYVFSVYYSGYAILPVQTGCLTAVLKTLLDDVSSVYEK